MIREDVIIEIPPHKLNNGRSNIHAFIAHYIEESRNDHIEKLGFDYNTFKESGGELFPTSLEIDFNYPMNSIELIIIHISILDIDKSHILLRSKLYNQSYRLLASAVSTFICINKSMKNSDFNLKGFFKNIEEKNEIYANY